MEKITFTNSRGEKITFSLKGPFWLKSISGTGGSEADVQTQKAPFQDGRTYIDTLMNERMITIEAIIIADDIFAKRAELLRVLNPKLGMGVLRYEHNEGVKEIEATVDMAPLFVPGSDNKGVDYQLTSFDLLCPSPFWTDAFTEEWTMASFTGGFSFPMSFPLLFGEVGQEVEVENKGDVDTPVAIKFKGPLTDPALENLTTGEKITITKDILDGETLEINTAFGEKSVEIVASDGTRSNAFHYISPDSDLWQLIPGINKLSYASTTAANNSAATVYFKHRYVGV